MAEKDAVNREDFARCAEFHGHVCPGLAIGYRAAKAALDRLNEKRSADEEIIAVVGTDNCGVDALQVLSGCTAGKGNLFLRNYGKNVYTLASRNSGEGVRVSLKADAFQLSEEHKSLLDKLRVGEATKEERERFQSLHREKAEEILSMPADKLFKILKVKIDLPAKAVIEPSELCERCGEPTMRSKLVQKEGRRVCGECASL